VHLRIAAVARRNIMVDTQKSCQLTGMTCDESLGGDDPRATVTGQRFYHQEPRATHPDADPPRTKTPYWPTAHTS
jgi:hypothetical protein